MTIAQLREGKGKRKRTKPHHPHHVLHRKKGEKKREH